MMSRYSHAHAGLIHDGAGVTVARLVTASHPRPVRRGRWWLPGYDGHVRRNGRPGSRRRRGDERLAVAVARVGNRRHPESRIDEGGRADGGDQHLRIDDAPVVGGEPPHHHGSLTPRGPPPPAP